MDVTKEYAPCPTCGQYSHSISGGFVEEASLHFNAMFSHRGDGLPTQHCFDERTRDMAQRLLAALTTAQSEAAELRAEVERLRAWKMGLVVSLQHSTRELRGGPQFPEVHRARMAYFTNWAEGRTREEAEMNLRAALTSGPTT